MSNHEIHDAVKPAHVRVTEPLEPCYRQVFQAINSQTVSRSEGREQLAVLLSGAEYATLLADVRACLPLPKPGEAPPSGASPVAASPSAPAQNILVSPKRSGRRHFSEREQHALREGVARFKVGKWSKIMEAYPGQFGASPIQLFPLTFSGGRSS